MSRLLHADMIPHAIYAARQSSCRSQRGVVIWDKHPQKGFISSGFNHQPAPFVCDGSEACKASCGKTAVHAEQAAILQASQIGRNLSGAFIMHVKVVEGLAVSSGGPSCVECSKLILEAKMAGMWLLLEQGWKFYNADEFHGISLAAQGLRVPGVHLEVVQG